MVSLSFFPPSFLSSFLLFHPPSPLFYFFSFTLSLISSSLLFWFIPFFFQKKILSLCNRRGSEWQDKQWRHTASLCLIHGIWEVHSCPRRPWRISRSARPECKHTTGTVCVFVIVLLSVALFASFFHVGIFTCLISSPHVPFLTFLVSLLSLRVPFISTLRHVRGKQV